MVKSSETFATLAPVQRATLEYLKDYIADYGCAPSLKSIAKHIGVKSCSTAHFHLERLEQKGFISRDPEGGAIKLAQKVTSQIYEPNKVPLLGVIAAGIPVEAIENKTYVDLPPRMVPQGAEVFCLEVSGDSMIDAHICDGDIVVIRKQEHAQNGEIVVALLDDGSATLKTYRRLKSGEVMLIPANSALKPMTLASVKVQGKVIGIMREM
jgi:repressor LexA